MMTSERDQLIGGHVTPAVKAALREEARKEGISVSRFIQRITVEKLREKGYDVKEAA